MCERRTKFAWVCSVRPSTHLDPPDRARSVVVYTAISNMTSGFLDGITTAVFDDHPVIKVRCALSPGVLDTQSRRRHQTGSSASRTSCTPPQAHHNRVASLPAVLKYYENAEGVRLAFKPLP